MPDTQASPMTLSLAGVTSYRLSPVSIRAWSQCSLLVESPVNKLPGFFDLCQLGRRKS